MRLENLISELAAHNTVSEAVIVTPIRIYHYILKNR